MNTEYTIKDPTGYILKSAKALDIPLNKEQLETILNIYEVVAKEGNIGMERLTSLHYRVSKEVQKCI